MSTFGDQQATRRDWMRNVGQTTVSAAIAGGLAGFAPHAIRPRHADAIEPIQREQPSFKFSLAAYSYRELLNAKQDALTLFDFVDDCARLNLHGVELTSYYFAKDVSDDDLRQLKRHCFRSGLDISGTAVGNDFGYPAGEQRDQQLTAVKQWIRRAEILAAPVIRIFAGHPHGATEQETHRLMVDGIQECCRHAGQHGVHLALENHGGPTSTAEGLLALVQDVDSPWFGVNLDTGNFHSANIYDELERVAPYALNVQVKATISGPNQSKQPADFARIARILQAANYRGYVVLEFEEQGDPRVECARLMGELRTAFANS